MVLYENNSPLCDAKEASDESLTLLEFLTVSSLDSVEYCF